MSRDSDLVVTCKCGKLSIIKYGGYYTSDILDAADLGAQAERLCRRKRLKKWAWFALATMVLCAGLAYGTGWATGRQDPHERVVMLLNRAFSYYRVRDYERSMRDIDEVLTLEPTNPNAKKAKGIISDVEDKDRRASTRPFRD